MEAQAATDTNVAHNKFSEFYYYGVKTETVGHFIVVELVSSSSQALRMKNAWKVSKEKYSKIKKEEIANVLGRTNESPARSDNAQLFTNSIPQSSEKSTPSEKKSYNLTEDAAEQAAREAAEVEQFRNEQDREAARVRQAECCLGF